MAKLIRELKFSLREDDKYDVECKTATYSRHDKGLVPVTFYCVVNDVPMDINNLNMVPDPKEKSIFTFEMEEENGN